MEGRGKAETETENRSENFGHEDSESVRRAGEDQGGCGKSGHESDPMIELHYILCDCWRCKLRNEMRKENGNS